MNVEAADAVLRAGVADGLWPGLVAAVGTGSTIEREWVLGAAEKWRDGYRAMTVDTVFDVASLTKVLATLPSVLVLVQDRRVDLNDVVADYVTGVDPRVRVHHLLTHTSGLPAHRLFLDVTSLAELVARCAAEALEGPPGVRVSYSDLGFVLLGAIVQAASGAELPVFSTHAVFAPLGMTATYDPPPSWLPRIASTEVVDGRVTHGVVHDENAAAAGGHTGHAGLFATLADVRAAIPLWLPRGPLLDEAIRTDAMRDHTAGLGGHRGLGWTCHGDGYDILSDGWGPAAVSHTGFTGTSMAIDPVTARWAVLLTNHVHCGRGRPEVFAARRRFHAALVGD